MYDRRVQHSGGVKRVIAAGIAAALALVLTPAAAQASLASEAAAEASWIINSAQAHCSGPARGAIAQAPFSYGAEDTQLIDAYRANYAALGLLAASTLAGHEARAADLKAVKEWVEWYFRHLNWPDDAVPTPQAGTVYYYRDRYTGTPGSACTEEKVLQENAESPMYGRAYYDAEDSWAATFLSVLGAWAKVDPLEAVAMLSSEAPNDYPYLIEAIANAAIANIGTTPYLTGADPWYTAKYTMDNAEVVQGLNAYAWLAEAYLGKPAQAAYWHGVAANIEAAMGEYLWERCGTGIFCVADGDPAYNFTACEPAEVGSSSYERFWDEGLGGVVQAWPSFAGLQPSVAHGSETLALLTLGCPAWFSSGRLPTPSQAEPYAPDAGIALAAEHVGYTELASKWLGATESNWIATGREWPWTVEEAGTLIRVAALLAGGQEVVPR